MNIYFDIETEGFDFKKDKIISIQVQEINNKGQAIGDLNIYKEWIESEEIIVKKVYKELIEKDNWNWVLVGTNLIFDLTFLWEKFKKYNLPLKQTLSEYLYNKPLIDLKYTLIMINGLNFKGASLDQMTNKKQSGKEVPNWYKNKDYDKIIGYITQETEAFLEFFEKCNKHLSKLKK